MIYGNWLASKYFLPLIALIYTNKVYEKVNDAWRAIKNRKSCNRHSAIKKEKFGTTPV